MPAKLYQECYAPLVLPSGKYSIMKGCFELSPQEAEKTPYAAEGCRTEWEYLSRILQHSGVPRRAILREDRATYTYENAIYSRAALDAGGDHSEKGDSLLPGVSCETGTYVLSGAVSGD